MDFRSVTRRAFFAGALAFSVFLPVASALAQSAPRVEMVIDKRGTVVVELMPKVAPKTVAHITDLVNKKFYDGTLIHRYVAGFVAQGGDPGSKKVDPKKAVIQNTQMGTVIEGLGSGGSGTNVPLEVDASARHARGTLGMARSMARDSGDSQFFFNLKDNTMLDGEYCVFGKVVKGMDVVDKLRAGDRIKSARVVKAKK